MSLDIAMGGSTNTVLHLLAAAQEGGVPFTMADIDRLSRRVPNLCKVAPSKPDVHLEDVHRAGGIMAILGELDRAGLIHRDVADGACADAGRRAGALGFVRRERQRRCRRRSSAPPPAACAPPRRSASQDATTRSTCDRANGVIRDVAHAFSQDGGLAVLLRQHRRGRRHRENRRRRCVER